MCYSINGVINMATKAHLEGNKRYLEKLDRGVFYVPKGGLERIKAHATKTGKSLNAYILGLIEADMGKLAEEEDA